MKHNDRRARRAALEVRLDAARRRIEVKDTELDEARRRRSLMAKALEEAFPGSRIYFNGSVAHGDALTPLTDVDFGIVVPNFAGVYGPGRRGPRVLMEQARDALKDAFGQEFPKLVVTIEGQSHAVLVRFGDPVTPGEKDFTADVIVAIDNPAGAGLFIPDLPDGWERSHPERHTQLVLEAIDSSDVWFARHVRLLKHYNRTHSKRLCSWNIKALALDSLAVPLGYLDGLTAWFDHAIEHLSIESTPDPAGVSIPIETTVTRSETVAHLKIARSRIRRAIALCDDGKEEAALAELARVFPLFDSDSVFNRVAAAAERAAWRLQHPDDDDEGDGGSGGSRPTPTPTPSTGPALLVPAAAASTSFTTSTAARSWAP